LLVNDVGVAAVLERQILLDLEHCREVKADRAKASFPRRLGDSCARLFSPLL
jgi:hypothetical protein